MWLWFGGSEILLSEAIRLSWVALQAEAKDVRCQEIIGWHDDDDCTMDDEEITNIFSWHLTPWNNNIGVQRRKNLQSSTCLETSPGINDWWQAFLFQQFNGRQGFFGLVESFDVCECSTSVGCWLGAYRKLTHFIKKRKLLHNLLSSCSTHHQNLLSDERSRVPGSDELSLSDVASDWAQRVWAVECVTA